LLAEDAHRALESAIEAAEQLAIYYEHRVKEPLRALELVREAIAELHSTQCGGPLNKERRVKIETRLSRRLSRLERRCGTAAPGKNRHGHCRST
jgi:hypothetical protein